MKDVAGQKCVLLVDMDGTLVDNVAFEASVGEFIVQRTATLRHMHPDRVLELWKESLSRERGTVKWYDYDQHCSNLGVPPLAKEAHEQAKHLLRTVPGAQRTWDWLTKHRVDLYIVSDSTTWVIRLKLDSLGIRGYTDLFSSQDVGTAKNSQAFWTEMGDKLHPWSALIYIDNKMSNLVAAATAIDRLTCIHFDRLEHWMILPQRLRPLDHSGADSTRTFPVVHDHGDLRSLVANWLGRGECERQG